MEFELLKKDKNTRARLGVMSLTHSTVETPIFMPVGTRGAVKTLVSQMLTDLDVRLILANTYHMMLKPGPDLVENAGGLHGFTKFPGSFLTDSGGFQVFSLSSLNKITNDGVHFKSHIDGQKFFLGPRESMEIQKKLGADIVMAFDECCPHPSDHQRTLEAWERTERWGKVCRDYTLKPHQNLFGIVQGGIYHDLRELSAKVLTKMDFDGYAIGGLSVGEPIPIMYEVLDHVEPYLPKEKPRYLMGVGTPRNLIECVMRGVDMFDCVMPTRNARNGTAFTWSGKINIKAGRYREDLSPLDPELDCYTSQFSKAYIRHLLNVDEMTGLTLVTIQNIAFYMDLMKKIREAIRSNTLSELYDRVSSIYPN